MAFPKDVMDGDTVTAPSLLQKEIDDGGYVIARSSGDYEWPKLPYDALVGRTVFRKGVCTDLVVDRAMREFRYCLDPSNLLSQDAEIDRLQSRLAAADALLRSSALFLQDMHILPQEETCDASVQLLTRIQSYRQGAGDEA